MKISLANLEITWICPDCQTKEYAGFHDTLLGETICPECARSRNKDIFMEYSDEAKLKE